MNKDTLFNGFFGRLTSIRMAVRGVESGRSMVEMLGVLAIIGVLTVGGVAGYNFAMNKHRANEIIQGVKERAVIGSGQRMNDHAVDFHEFPELIIDYTTSGRNTGLNGEKEFFSVDVADVPQAVCQNVLNMNWDWPSGVFVNGQDIETCPTENSQMTFVFAADLSSKIAQEQDPCLGNSCCMAPDKQPIFGVTMDLYECKGEGQKICCKQTIPNACVYPQHSNYETYVSNAQKAENPTCEQDPKQYCDRDLNCLCRACPNASMVQNAACDCSCPNGYLGTPCGAGQYMTAKLEDADGVPVCYQCAGCPGDETPPANKCSVARTEAGQNGCPDRTVYDEVPCACDSGYTTNACGGTDYQVDMKTLTDGTQCYKCAECPELPDQDSDCSYTMGTDANGCPTQTLLSCACSDGYTKNACEAGSYAGVEETLADETTCHKCETCPGIEDPDPRCTYEDGTDANGCPTRTIVSCACDTDEGYTTKVCEAGKSYTTAEEKLPNDTMCYQCKMCPELSEPIDGCTYITGTDENGCPTQTLSHCDCPSDITYNNGKTPCDESQYDFEYQQELADGTTCYQCREKEVCEAGYTLEKCAGTIMQSYRMNDGRTCYKCVCSKGCCCPDGYTCPGGKDGSRFTKGCKANGGHGKEVPQVICPVGYYCKYGEQNACPGRSATSYGTGFSTAEECRNCDNGYISVDKQRCLRNCPEGAYSQDGKCKTCPKGSYCINNKKYDCDPKQGKYTNKTGSVSCSTCPNGKYTKDGKSCVDCPSGYKCENGVRRGCKASEGYIGKKGVCKRCGNGKFAFHNDASKWGIRCDVCKKGFACVKGVATACDPTKGEANEKTGQSSCAICGAGKYAKTASSCASCPAGRYCSGGKIAGDCWASDGKMSKAGASSCTVCAEGKYAKAVSKNDDHGTSCFSCPTGKTCSGGKILD